MKKEEARDEMNRDAGSVQLWLLVVVLQWLLLDESRNRADGRLWGKEVCHRRLAERPIARPRSTLLLDWLRPDSVRPRSPKPQQNCAAQSADSLHTVVLRSRACTK